MIFIFSKILELVSWHFKDTISQCILFLENKYKISASNHMYKRSHGGDRFSEK